MRIRHAVTVAIPIALVGTIAATPADALFFDNAQQLQNQVITGDAFNDHLAREYQQLTKFEWAQMNDWYDAEAHATKGMMAARGETPMPYEPTQWGIESKAAMNELEDARIQLIAKLEGGAKVGAPSLAAQAQAGFDCWVEQQEEGHQADHISACKEKFWKAMASVDAALAPPPPPEPEAKLVTTVVSQEVGRELIFFDFDEARLTPVAEAKIDAFVEQMRDIDAVELSVVGHTDTAGPADYNRVLAAERAGAVTNALIERGMKVRALDEALFLAEGESDPAVETGDGVAEPRNRRVEIIAIGDVEVQQRVTAVETQ